MKSTTQGGTELPLTPRGGGNGFPEFPKSQNFFIVNEDDDSKIDFNYQAPKKKKFSE